MAIWNARLYNELKTAIYINKGANLAMPETEPSSQSSILDSLKLVIHNGIDYLMSSLSLLQSKMTGLALSAILFLVTLFICFLLALTAFVLLTVALGMWLAQVTGHPAWALVILGFFYALLAALTAKWALGWVNKLNS